MKELVINILVMIETTFTKVWSFRIVRTAGTAVAGIGILGLVILLITRDGCDNQIAGLLGLRVYHIDTWTEWRQEYLEPSRERERQSIAISVSADEVREDFIAQMRAMMIDTILKDSTNELTREEIELGFAKRKLGLWNDNATIHFANVFLNDSLSKLQWRKEFVESLTVTRDKVSEEDYLVSQTVLSLFKCAVLHTSRKDSIVIKLPFFNGK